MFLFFFFVLIIIKLLLLLRKKNMLRTVKQFFQVDITINIL